MKVFCVPFSQEKGTKRGCPLAGAMVRWDLQEVRTIERRVIYRYNISGMMGPGSISHNNRKFFAANVDRSRTEQNVTYCNDDLKQIYTRSSTRPWPPTTPKRKRPGIRSQTIMSISGRESRRRYFTRRSSRSATWRTAGAAPWRGTGGGSSQRICGELPGAQPPSAGV